MRDGLFTAAGRCFARAGDAALMRRTVATRLRADAIRGVPRAVRELRAILHPVDGDSKPAPIACVWYRDAIGAHEEAVQLGGRPVHAACAAQGDVV